jgi:hypothetical protein
MTCIVDHIKYSTKKKLKEDVEKGIVVFIEDPSIVHPRTFTTSEMNDGDVVVVTNHPKRSYFAQIKKSNGMLKVI